MQRKRVSAGAPPAQGADERPETGTRFSAGEIHDNVMSDADQELERPVVSLFLSSLASGLAIGFSFIGGAFARNLASGAVADGLAAAAYPLGFIFVIMARSELFTENTLTPVLPLLHRRDMQTLRRMLRVWGVLLAGNLVGTLIFSWLMAQTPAASEPLKQVMLTMSERASETPFLLTVYRGVFAGWLIALLTWLLASTRATGAQLMLIWLLTAPIAAFGFTHAIVGSTEAFYRAWAGAAGWGPMWSFVLAAVIGNAIGGVTLVALLNYGQVVTDSRPGRT